MDKALPIINKKKLCWVFLLFFTTQCFKYYPPAISDDSQFVSVSQQKVLKRGKAEEFCPYREGSTPAGWWGRAICPCWRPWRGPSPPRSPGGPRRSLWTSSLCSGGTQPTLTGGNTIEELEMQRKKAEWFQWREGGGVRVSLSTVYGDMCVCGC